MSTDNENQLPAVRQNQAPAFRMDNNFTVADILSVAVSKAETKLQADLKVATTKNKDIEKRIKQIGKDLDVQVDVLRKECGLQNDIDVVNKVLEKLFDSLIVCSADIDEKRKVVIYQYSLKHSSASEKRVQFSAEITRLVALLNSENESLEAVMAEIAEIRKRLVNIPALERRYRGKLVATQLAKTAEGKNILEVITENIEDELKSL